MPTDPGQHYRIPLSRPRITEADRRSVLSVLESHRLAGGPWTERFEAVSRETLGVSTVSCSSGTAGLILALKALGVNGGEVITPALGFIASAHAICAVGATPRFCDVSAESLCSGPEEMDRVWNDQVQAVMPVDLLGVPAPIGAMMDWAATKGVPVIEDACEALGSKTADKPCGSLADAASFGFYPNKILTMGEGGLVACRDEELATRIRQLANQGRTGPGFSFAGEGFNFRLTEMQAALGVSQWEGLETRISDREKIAEHYLKLLVPIDGVEPAPAPPLDQSGDRRSWFTFVVLLRQKEWRSAVRQHLAGQGIETGLYFPSITDFEPYDHSPRGELTVTEDVSPRMLALPFHADLTLSEVEEVVAVLEKAVSLCD